MRKKEIFASIVGNWKRKKPIWVMLMIKSLTEAEMKSHGVLVFDHYLALQAERFGKHVGAIESVDEQCQPLDGLNDTQVFIALNHTLIIQERFGQGQVQDFFSSDDLIHQYICGELNLVKSNNKSNQVRLLNSSLTLKRRSMSRDEVETDVELYLENELIYRRNKRMVKRIKTLLDAKSNKSFFFAFGAGHFLGNNSVIELLRKDGYSIDHIKAKTFKRRSFKKIRKHSHSDSFSAWLQVQAWADDVEQHGFRNQKRFGKRRLHSHPSRRNKLTTRNNHKVHRKRNLSMNVEERSFNQTSSSANKEHGGLFTRYSHTFAGKTRSPLRVVDLKLKRSSSHFDGYKQSSGKSTIYFDSTKKSKRTKPKLRRRRKYHRKPTSNKISYSFSSPEKGLSVEIWEELLPKKIKRYNSNSSPMHQGQVLLCVFMAMISALTVQVNASYWFNALKLDTSKGHADAYESKRTSVNKQHSFYAKKAKDFVLKV